MPGYAQQDATFFSPYADITLATQWSSQYQTQEPMDLTQVSQVSGIKNYHLAFITDAGACHPAWGGQASYATDLAWGVHLTDKLRAEHINYIVSLGGASGADLSLACSESQLIATYEKIIKIYQPQGLDFDIENGTADIAKLMSALQTVQRIYPALKISFTLPVMPDGLVANGQEVLRHAKVANLIYSVNIMAMDYGPAYTEEMGQYAIQAATHLFNFLHDLYPEKSNLALWQMIEITPMIGVNDVAVEKFTLADVTTLVNFAHKNQLGGLSMWSITRDHPCADTWASPTCSGGNLQTEPYAFARRFLQ